MSDTITREAWPEAPAPAIELVGVSKTFPGAAKAAVQDVHLSISPGSIVTLLGPSGCGKTTTLRLIAGFERPDSGTVVLGGRIVSSADAWTPPERRGVGMVFQQPTLFPNLTAAGNIGFNYNRPDRADRVAELLALVGLEGLGGRFPHQLSGGQQQRVALARALARRPVVVLLDEPFNGLDARLREQMRTEMRRIINQERTTAVFVTHDRQDALAISDQVVVMRDGAIEQQAPPELMYRCPANEFVAGFMGLANLVPGVVEDGGEVRTDFGVFQLACPAEFGRGARVKVAIPPEAWEMSSDEGQVQDILAEVRGCVFAGDCREATLSVTQQDGQERSLMVRFDSDVSVDQGCLVRVRPLQAVVPAMVQEEAPEGAPGTVTGIG